MSVLDLRKLSVRESKKSAAFVKSKSVLSASDLKRSSVRELKRLRLDALKVSVSSELDVKKRNVKERKRQIDFVSSKLDAKKRNAKDWRKSASVRKKKSVADSSRSVLSASDLKRSNARELKKNPVNV